MHMTVASRLLTATVVGGVLALGITACSSDGGAESSEPADDTTDAAAEDDLADDAATEKPAADDEAPEADSGADPAAPEWATPVTTPGEQIATIEGETVRVDVYHVGVTQAPQNGLFADPETNEPIIAKGDDIVFVNYVVTNTADHPVDLGVSLVEVDATYEDWPYAQGMDTITDSDLFAEMNVNEDGSDEYLEPSIYPLQPGQAFSYGTNFLHQPGSPITFDATLTPVDHQGELISDERQEASATATIS